MAQSPDLRFLVFSQVVPRKPGGLWWTLVDSVSLSVLHVCCTLASQGAPIPFARATPDPEYLPVLERVGEALALDAALSAESLRRLTRLAPLRVEERVALVDGELGAPSSRPPVRLEQSRGERSAASLRLGMPPRRALTVPKHFTAGLTEEPVS